MLLYVIYTLFSTMNSVIARIIYDRNPDLSPFQYLVLRSSCCLCWMVIYNNKDLKKNIWDGIDRASAPILLFRSLQGATTNIINFTNNKYLPMTIIAIFNNMAPMIAIILAYFILKEKIQTWTVVMMAFTIVGVLEVVFTGDTSQVNGNISETTTTILYITMVLNPFLGAGGTIAMRKMKKFHESVVSWYLNCSLLTVNLTITLAAGLGFQVYGTFEWQDWLLIVAAGFTSVCS